jgi:Flp pilus assembly pilin Flp
MQRFYDFWRRQEGQDIVEYSLLVAFLAITCLALMASVQSPIQGMWSKGSNTVASANTNLSGS